MNPLVITSTILAIFAVIADLTERVSKKINNATDLGRVSLPAYTRPIRLCSRVYIDTSVASDAIVTDVIKTIHTQYAAFVLAAMQLSQFVTESHTVQDLLRVVATEDNKVHESVVAGLFSNVSGAMEAETQDEMRDRHHRETRDDRLRQRQDQIDKNVQDRIDRNKAEADKLAARKAEREEDKKERANRPLKTVPTTGKIVSLAGDNHIPAGKVIEVTIASPGNPEASTVLNLFIQLVPYLIPVEIGVQFITKDVIPHFFQRLLQWKTGEISFWRDLVAMSDVVERREKLRKMDPTGVLADAMSVQDKGRLKVFGNINKDKATRARNLANSVLIFSSETLKRAKAESGIDLTDNAARSKYFDTSFTMIIAVIDPLYDQVTFYYNGIPEAATFSFDQIKIGGKGGSPDLISIMNALNQGRSPKF